MPVVLVINAFLGLKQILLTQGLKIGTASNQALLVLIVCAVINRGIVTQGSPALVGFAPQPVSYLEIPSASALQLQLASQEGPVVMVPSACPG